MVKEEAAWSCLSCKRITIAPIAVTAVECLCGGKAIKVGKLYKTGPAESAGSKSKSWPSEGPESAPKTVESDALGRPLTAPSRLATEDAHRIIASLVRMLGGKVVLDMHDLAFRDDAIVNTWVTKDPYSFVIEVEETSDKRSL